MIGNRKKETLHNLLFILPGFILLFGIVLIPYIMNIIISLTEWGGVKPPEFVGLDNYISALQDAKFWQSFINNILLIIAMSIVPAILGIILSIILFEIIGKGPLKNTVRFFRAGFYLPQIIALVVSAVAWKWLLHPSWGVINELLISIGLDSYAHNWLGDSGTAIFAIMVLMTWYQTGYTLVIFLSALQRINPELIEAASIDGAKLPTIVFRIIIPQIRFEISVVILTTMIHALKVFGPVYAMTKGGPGTSTYVISFYSVKSFFEKNQVGYGSAISTITSLIIIIITIIFIRYSSRHDRVKKENE